MSKDKFIDESWKESASKQKEILGGKKDSASNEPKIHVAGGWMNEDKEQEKAEEEVKK